MKKLLNFFEIQTQNEEPGPPVLPKDANVLAHLKEFIHYAEFKRILDKIATAQKQQNIKSIAILSELPNEGKTFVTAAIAAGLSELLKTKVLVVDTQTMNTPTSLTLNRALEIDDLPYKKSGPQKTLLVNTDFYSLQSQQSSAGGLMEYQLSELIQKYKDKYGFIIFDTSALSAKNRNNIDPWVIARHVDTNLLVIGKKTLRKSLSPHFFERTEADKLKIGGLIYNEGTSHE